MPARILLAPVKGCSLRPKILAALFSYILSGFIVIVQAQEYQFNTDVLDVIDRNNLDIEQFSKSGYIMPGNYVMAIHINKQELPEQTVTYYSSKDDDKGSVPCLTPKMVETFGIKPEFESRLQWWHGGECLLINSIDGMTAHGDIGTAVLQLGIPATWLEYSYGDWEPPSRWENGIPGLLLDYNLNTQVQRQQKTRAQGLNASGNGTVGANFGPWRLRADWQTRFDRQGGDERQTSSSWDWSRYYAYRAIPRWGAALTLGENYLNSAIFDSFRFAGGSLVSDDSMLPPNLRGYAPEITGIAKTNAKVIVSQQGRIIQETQVAAGPFRIQDISDSVSGQLDVRVEEQDGSVQEFKMNTATVPYLTRPGLIRYKVAAGRPNDWQHRTSGPLFTTGEFSWGINNGWSLYGGGVAGGDYNALALGVGRDLLMFGALSLDVTQSRAKLPQNDNALSGGSYRLSYSKSFDDYGSQVTFAGYRFSQLNYMSMSEYLDALKGGVRSQNSKEMYTITFNQQLSDWGLSAYLNYSHQTYWNQLANERYTLTLSRYFDLNSFKNISLSLTGYRNNYNRMKDDGMYMTLSLPWGTSGSVGYSGSFSQGNSSQQANFYNRMNDSEFYQLSSGVSQGALLASGSYTRQGGLSEVGINASYLEGSYVSAGASFQGGATATLEGAALHRIGSAGSTRILLDTDGVPDIPLAGYGASTRSNRFGKAVVTDVGSYYANRISIDLNHLPDNADALRSVVQTTLTEGAIGYRKFEVISGEKAMAVIRTAEGTEPPFGATVINARKQNVGIVSEGGNVYLSGINPGERMNVRWNGKTQCELTLPQHLSVDSQKNLLLPCH